MINFHFVALLFPLRCTLEFDRKRTHKQKLKPEKNSQQIYSRTAKKKNVNISSLLCSRMLGRPIHYNLSKQKLIRIQSNILCFSWRNFHNWKSAEKVFHHNVHWELITRDFFFFFGSNMQTNHNGRRYCVRTHSEKKISFFVQCTKARLYNWAMQPNQWNQTIRW